VIRTEPRNILSEPISTAVAIVLYFNSSLKPDSVKFAESADKDGIWITANDKNVNENYYDPVYSVIDGFNIITISPKNILSPANSLIKVRVTGIENYHDLKSSEFVLSWRTKDKVAAEIKSWDAKYNEIVGSTTGNIDLNLSDAVWIETYYRINGGEKKLFEKKIENIPKIDNSGVHTGISTGGINEYLISIELFINGIRENYRDFKLWNIPGMSVYHDIPLIELTQEKFSAELKADNRNYVLTQHIILDDWTPIGTGEDEDIFRGKFYGNGFTITINSFAEEVLANYGLFGIVQGASAVQQAEIRDLRVEYADMAINEISTVNFGGITGQANGNTKIQNIVIVVGNESIGLTLTTATSTVGGITGSLQANAAIENCYTNLNLNVGSSGDINLGGIAGVSGGSIINSIVAGNLIMSGSGSGYSVFGGIVGRMTGGTIFSCNNNAVINVPGTYSKSGLTFIGGVAGRVGGSAAAEIMNTNATGNITITSTGTGEVFIGGVSGASNYETSATVTFTNCEYFDGDITFTRNTNSGPVNIGGFAGYINSTTLNNCWSGALIKERALIKVNYNTGTNLNNIQVGGFAGVLSGNVTGCYSKISIDVDFNSPSADASDTQRNSFGGFAGLVNGNNIIQQCYATGDIDVISRGTDSFHYHTGGFAGLVTGSTKFIYCYATGSVKVHRSNPSGGGNTDAGGFLSGIWEDGIEIESCFSASSVIVASNKNTSGSIGGLVGWIRDFSKIHNSIAFGLVVSFKNQNSGTNVDRLYNTNSSLDVANNRASDQLKLHRATSYSDINVLPAAYTSPLSPSPTNGHGATVDSITALYNPGFWRITMGYSDSIWDFSGLASHGYPLLKGVGGQ